MFVIECANIDPDDFTWLVFKRATSLKTSPKKFNQRHTLILTKGDLFGVRKTRKGSFQLVKADSLHVLFRAIPDATYNNILKNSKEHTGPTPSDQDVDEGFTRKKRVDTKEKSSSNKMKDDYYKAHKEFGKILETSSIDFKHYQWRKLSSGSIKLTSKKAGKVQTVLRTGDVVGVRYKTPARGGYIIYDDDKRVHIEATLYDDIIKHSRVLPESEQRSGDLDLDTGVKSRKVRENRVARRAKVRRMPKADRSNVVIPQVIEEEPVAPKYDLSDVDDADVLKHAKRRGKVKTKMRHAVRSILNVPVSEPYVDEDDEEAFDPEVLENEVEVLPEEPSEEGVDGEDFDSEEPEEDDGFEDEEQAADVLLPGTIIQITKGRARRFVVLQSEIMERNENLMEYFLYDLEDSESDFFVYKLRLPIDATVSGISHTLEIDPKEYDEDELIDLQNSIDMAEFKNLPLIK
jgi:hypothetical protein